MLSAFKIFRGDGNWHPDGEDLLRYLDGEQPSGKSTRIRLHLEACWSCRTEAERIGQTISAFTDYRKEVLLPALSAATADSAGFQQRLHALAADVKAEHQRPSMLSSVRFLVEQSLRRPFVVPAGAVALVLLAAVLTTYVWSPVVNAQELLARSSAAEQGLDRNPALVSHRSLRLEKRRYGSSRILSRKRIDIWRSGTTGVTARRVYDESGKLVAGEWSHGDGTSAVYELGAARKVDGTEPRLPKLLAVPEELWRFDLSARGFEELVARGDSSRVEKSGPDYLVHFSPKNPEPQDNLLNAVLTVRRADLHITQFELTVRTEPGSTLPGDPAPTTYSMVEDGFEQRPASTVQAQLFEADSELVAAAVGGEQQAASVDLQLEAMYLLDGIGATLGQEVTTAISSDRKLHIEAIASSDARKAEILAALNPVRNNPAVIVDILTVAEALRRENVVPSANSIAEAKIQTGPIPAFGILQSYFRSQLPGAAQAEISGKIQQYSQHVMAESGEGMRHAWVLRRIAGTLAPSRIGDLSPDRRGQYLCMLRAHAQAVAEHTEKLRLQLDPIFFAGTPAIEDATSATEPRDVETALRELFDLVSYDDHAVQANFSLTSGDTEGAAASVQEIRGSLLRSVRVAAWIRNNTGKVCDSGRMESHATPSARRP